MDCSSKGLCLLAVTLTSLLFFSHAYPGPLLSPALKNTDTDEICTTSFVFEMTDHLKLKLCAEKIKKLNSSEIRIEAGDSFELWNQEEAKKIMEGGGFGANPTLITKVGSEVIKVAEQVTDKTKPEKYYSFITTSILCRNKKCTVSTPTCAVNDQFKQMASNIRLPDKKRFEKVKKLLKAQSNKKDPFDDLYDLSYFAFVKSLAGESEAKKFLQRIANEFSLDGMYAEVVGGFTDDLLRAQAAGCK